MALKGTVDLIKETQISGWAVNEENLDLPVYVDILIGLARIASIRCSLYREDLKRAGIGDGRKAFSFDPSEYLAPGLNEVEVRFSESGALVPKGRARVIGTHSQDFDTLNSEAKNCLLSLSQERWKGSEEDRHLTWGEVMTGDSFLEALKSHYRFSTHHHICEIGPGYGRLLKTILEQSLPFAQYTGIDLSQERVNKLNSQFANERIKFICADVNDVKLPVPTDLFICSATFEHLFPDFSRALDNLVNINLASAGAVAIDFIQSDDAMQERGQAFDPEGYNFARVYSSEEIMGHFAGCGLKAELSSIVLGKGVYGDVRRIFAFAKRLSPGSDALPHRSQNLTVSLQEKSPGCPAEDLDKLHMEDWVRAVDMRLNDLSEHRSRLQDRLNQYVDVPPLRWMRRLRAFIGGFPPPHFGVIPEGARSVDLVSGL
jgi:Methyltransferase domain